MVLPPWLARVVRIALQVVLFLLLLPVVIAVASAETGPFEKAALIALGALLVWAAVLVARLGARGSPPAGAVPPRDSP